MLSHIMRGVRRWLRLLHQIRTETLIQGFSPFLYVSAKSKCKTTFAPGNLQVFSLPQSQKFPEQFLPQKPHRENAPTVFGGCITKRLPGFRFVLGANSRKSWDIDRQLFPAKFTNLLYKVPIMGCQFWRVYFCKGIEQFLDF